MKTKKITSLVLTATMAQGTIVSALTNNIDNNKTSSLESNKEHKSKCVVNGIGINKNLITTNYSKGVIINPKYIVIHDTGNTAYGAGAINHRNYFANYPNIEKSAHYIVDDKNIVQALEDNWRGLHIEDEDKRIDDNKPEVNNNNSIGIELTVNKDSNFDVALKNAIELTKTLMKKYNIPSENVITHKDVTGKICPKRIVEDEPYLWKNFKKSIENANNKDTSFSSGIYSLIKDVRSIVNYSGKLDVLREKNIVSNTVGVVYNKEQVKLNYIDGEWGNITFNSSQGGTRTGFVKIDNLDIDGITKINKDFKITSSSKVTVYKDLNNTYQDDLIKGTEIIVNYTYKEWANISYNNKNGFINKELIEANDSDINDIDISNKNNIAKIVNAKSISIKQENKIDSPTLKVMYKNEDVRINFNQGEWANVTFKNSLNQEKVGFVKREYLNIVNQLGRSERPALTGKGQVINVSTNLRIRKGAGTNHDVLGLMYPNDKFDILGKQDSWYKILFNGKTGYVHKDYVKILNDVSTDYTNNYKNENQESLCKGKVVNVVSQLNMRSGGSTSYSLIGSLKPNDVFDILKKENQWYKIKFNGKIGFIHGDYVEELKSNSSNSNNANNISVNTLANASENASIKKCGQVINAPSGLRVREGSGTNYGIVTMISNNQKVKILGREGTWYKISVNDKTGYVYSEYIKETNEDMPTNTNTPIINTSNNTTSQIEQCNSKRGRVKNVSSTLRIREDAGTSYNTLGYLNNKQEFDILGKKNGWYKIKCGDKTGYINGQYVEEVKDNGSNSNNGSINNGQVNNSTQEVIINKRGKVVNITSSVRVRSNPSTDGSVVGYLTQGATFDIISKNGKWYKIKFDTYNVKKEGYVHSDYVEEYHEVANNNQLGKQVADYAKNFLGISYVWGGTTPRGFDCSGLMQYVFNHFGIKIGRTTWDQIKNGQRVDMSAIKEGDIILFGSNNNPTHVGMYIGNNQFIHAPKPGDVVKISTLSTYGMNKIQVNRIIN